MYHEDEIVYPNVDHFLIYNQYNGYQEDVFLSFDISAIAGNVSSCKLFFRTDDHEIIEDQEYIYIRSTSADIDINSISYSSLPSLSSGYTRFNAGDGERYLGTYTWIENDITQLVNTSFNSLSLRLYPTSVDPLPWSVKVGGYGINTSYVPYIEITTVGIEYDNIYVDPVNGSDANAGTQTYPLASISLAASRVNANGTVHIKAGSVWAPSAGQIGPTNKPVTYYIY